MARRQPIEKRVGIRVRALREEAGLTQRALAEKARTSRSQVAAIECGAASPTVGTLEAFAIALHTTISVLLDEADYERNDRAARLMTKLREGPPEHVQLLEDALKIIQRAEELARRRSP